MTPWWADAVVYQIYPRSFADSNGDGIGDLPGILGRLDHLQDLGVDVLWLSPIYPSPQADNGYDVSDYRGIDPMFGTLADFDALLAEVHRRGMRLIMDLVVNHTSDQHPWFLESRSSLDNPKRDWYWWRAGSGDAPPNNWGSIFSGSAWQRDEATGEYYLHLFAPQQPDLNWENPAVRAAVHDLMNWWLDRGVDGFRMDVLNLISKDPALPDGEKLPGDLYGNGTPSFRNGARLHEYLQEMHAHVFAGRDPRYLTVGECHGTPVELARVLTDQSRGELDMLFHFEHVEVDHGRIKWLPREYSLVELKDVFARWQYGLADVGWNTLYWNNHDQPRVVSRYGDHDHWYESATLLATVLHLHRGTPFIYQGEEIGMTNFPFTSITQIQDLESLNFYRQSVERRGRDPRQMLEVIAPVSRDNARTPMQWEGGLNAGFTTGTPWFPVNPNSGRINVAAQRGDPGSVLAYYRRLVALRHEDPVVQQGRYDLLLPDDPQVWAFTRTGEQSRLLVVANMGSDPVDSPLPLDGELALGNYADPHTRLLRPWEVRVLRETLP